MADEPTPLFAHYTKVPYGTRVGSVLKPSELPQRHPFGFPRSIWSFPLVALVHKPGVPKNYLERRRMLDITNTWTVCWVSEFGEGMWKIADRLDPFDAFQLSRKFPAFREQIRHRITDSEHAYWWAYTHTEDHRLMKHLVKESKWVTMWNEDFPRDRIHGVPVDPVPNDVPLSTPSWPMYSGIPPFTP